MLIDVDIASFDTAWWTSPFAHEAKKSFYQFVLFNLLCGIVFFAESFKRDLSDVNAFQFGQAILHMYQSMYTWHLIFKFHDNWMFIDKQNNLLSFN